MQSDRPELAVPISSGRYHLRGNGEIIVTECDDRFFIAPEDDCVLEVHRGFIRLRPVDRPKLNVLLGITSPVSAVISSSPSTADLFSCISSLCHVPGEESVLRSHPFFRRPLRIRSASPEDRPGTQRCYRSGITFSLPGDLRYLYAASPLAYYIRAEIKKGESPVLSVAGEQLPLPQDARAFEQWAGNMLHFVFQLDCAVRYEATSGKLLAGRDVLNDTCISPGKLASLSIDDRLLTYISLYHRGGIKQMPWHTASYLDPVSSSIRLIPSLMQSLSGIFYPGGRNVTEREVVQMGVRQFLGTVYRAGGSGDYIAGHIILPTLENAFIHQWLSDGYPIDAIKQLRIPADNRQLSCHASIVPRIAIVCNEDRMLEEAIALRNSLKNIASITMRRNLPPEDLVGIFSEGYDIVQFIGHCDSRGFKCNKDFADLSIVTDNNTPIFFFNSCSSYLQGIRLLEKGSVCGISTLYRIMDEAAIDISIDFYRLLARGYPVLMAYLGAKECSVLGKEYVLMGDGLISPFGSNVYDPLYRLTKSSYGYSLSCITAGFEKGFIHNATGEMSPGLPDFGNVLNDVPFDMLADNSSFPAGSCIWNGKLFDSIADAVLSIIEPVSVPATRSYTYTS